MIEQEFIGTWAAGYRFRAGEHNHFQLYVSRFFNGWGDWTKIQDTAWGKGKLGIHDNIKDAENEFGVLCAELEKYNNIKLKNQKV